MITDVSCPRNCVLYFGSGASRGDWKPRSNPSSPAQHPSHALKGQGEVREESGGAHAQPEKCGNWLRPQNPPWPSIFSGQRPHGSGVWDPHKENRALSTGALGSQGPGPSTHSFTDRHFCSISHMPGTVLGCRDRAVNRIDHTRGAGILKRLSGTSSWLYSTRAQVSSPAPLPTGQAPHQSGPGTALGPPTTPLCLLPLSTAPGARHGSGGVL